MLPLGSLLACTFSSPCFGREPKARVVTTLTFFSQKSFESIAFDFIFLVVQWQNFTFLFNPINLVMYIKP
jgi:hypothetical protein